MTGGRLAGFLSRGSLIGACGLETWGTRRAERRAARDEDGAGHCGTQG